MKVLAINGSPRKSGNTAQALSIVSQELMKEGVEVELVHVGAKNVHGCLGCNKCKELKRCCIDSDGVNDLVQKMMNADGILVGSPVYYAGINGTLKSFLDRAFYVAAMAGGKMRHKVGAAVVVARRSGVTVSVDQINKYFQISEMLMPAANYWSGAHGWQEGEVQSDAEGMQIMRVLGKNMAWLLKTLDFAKGHVMPPAREDKTMTNFIR